MKKKVIGTKYYLRFLSIHILLCHILLYVLLLLLYYYDYSKEYLSTITILKVGMFL